MISLEELIQFTELLISVATLFYVLGRNNGKKITAPTKVAVILIKRNVIKANRLSVALLWS
ncbi:MAG: hypothetical protein ACLTIG_04340 [Roseburia hominis]